MTETVVLICAGALVIIAFIAGVTINSVYEWQFKKAAVEHGCGVTDTSVVCAHGDRK